METPFSPITTFSMGAFFPLGGSKTSSSMETAFSMEAPFVPVTTFSTGAFLAPGATVTAFFTGAFSAAAASPSVGTSILIKTC
jgi:hypothetical protein